MVRHLVFLLCLCLCLIDVSSVNAVDTSTDSIKSKKHDKEQSQSRKKSIEQKGAFELKVSIDSVIVPELVGLERKGYLKSCNIISRPKLPRDFGISTEVSEGIYDVIKSQILEQQAKTNAVVTNNNKLQNYKNCMALYGAIIAQSHINLLEMLTEDSISLEDLKTLAKIAVEKTIYGGISNQNIKRLYNIVKNDTTACKFNSSLSSFTCGLATIDLATQRLNAGGVTLYGEKFYNHTGEYVVSQSSTKTKEQVLTQKKAWELAKSGRQVLSPSKLVPGF